MKKTNQKLTFHKKEIRVLDQRELTRIKGGNAEMDIEGTPIVVEINPSNR
jgi:natural product precursor